MYSLNLKRPTGLDVVSSIIAALLVLGILFAVAALEYWPSQLNFYSVAIFSIHYSLLQSFGFNHRDSKWFGAVLGGIAGVVLTGGTFMVLPLLARLF